MRTVTGRPLATVLVGMALAATSACGEAAPALRADPTAAPAASAATGDSRTACDAVIQARKTALEALAPLSTALTRKGLPPADIAWATDRLKAAFNAMHLDVAAAAERAADPSLRTKLSQYQLSVEQAIVVVEGADGDQATLAAVIELPEMRSAEQAVMAACA
jgi:hypothetical protein